jgi:hypothetical protein
MHTYAFHMEIKAGHRHRAVTSTGTWSCMRGWHRPTQNSQWSCIIACIHHLHCDLEDIITLRMRYSVVWVMFEYRYNMELHNLFVCYPSRFMDVHMFSNLITRHL